MAIDERVKTLEDEFKLIKNELKVSTVAVRDFLLGLKLPDKEKGKPSPELHQEYHEAAPNSGPGGSGSAPPEIRAMERPEGPMSDQAAPQAGAMARPEGPMSEEYAPPGSEVPLPEAQPDMEIPLPEVGLEEGPPSPQEETLQLPDTSEQFEQEEISDVSEVTGTEETPVKPLNKKAGMEDGRSALQVNLLANLIRWVASARRELGARQLPVLLDIYSIGRQLLPEIREVILHLEKVIAPDPADVSVDLAVPQAKDGNGHKAAARPSGESAEPAKAKSIEINADWAAPQTIAASADACIRLIMELHGILGNSEAALHLMKLPWQENEENELRQGAPDEEQENMQVSLKLVLPTGDGEEKEFSIEGLHLNLTPKANEESIVKQSEDKPDVRAQKKKGKQGKKR